ncbi:LIM domain transcription factor LMO4 isoform X1 [Dermochelys coriacea]|uniref:LIM domain transcription factor LMO4 isoform X1 n=1 Tax=Dermochelys coriacea TaxID=27794 RepID=UPI001CA8032C|nr:LIM domain transcription factor LMO4 isoform X1 [Dermochelys coriacea]
MPGQAREPSPGGGGGGGERAPRCHSRGWPQPQSAVRVGEGREPPGNEFISLVINSKLLCSGNAVPLIEQASCYKIREFISTAKTTLFGNSGACSACGQSIPASELVMRAQGNVYHLKCFTCSTCRNRLVPGDRFHYINGSLFCEHDRPTALINGHLNSLQSNPLLPDQKVC